MAHHTRKVHQLDLMEERQSVSCKYDRAGCWLLTHLEETAADEAKDKKVKTILWIKTSEM